MTRLGWGLIALCLFACDSTEKPEKRKPTAADVVGPFVTAKPSELVFMYRSNAVAADREYKGRALRIPGIIDRVGQDADGIPLVVMRDDPSYDNTRMLTIQCAWGASMDKVASLSAGQRFVARGIGAGVHLGGPLVVLCDGERPPNEEASIQAPKTDADWWRKNLEMFLDGKDVKKRTITFSDDKRSQVRIETDKCDRARLAVEQLGAFPEGFSVECFTTGKGSAAFQWRLPERAGSGG